MNVYYGRQWELFRSAFKQIENERFQQQRINTEVDFYVVGPLYVYSHLIYLTLSQYYQLSESI